jgi:hypothetical protein
MRCIALIVVVAAGTVSSCGASGDRGQTGLPRTPQSTVVLTMSEYRFAYEQPVPSGRVVFRVVNAGRSPHSLTLLPLSKDVPPIAEQLRGSARRIITPLAGVPDLPAGSDNSFAADLVPGQRYALLDFSQSSAGSRSNALLGMSSEFRAGVGS